MEYTINFDNKALRYIQVNFVGDTSSRSSSQYYEVFHCGILRNFSSVECML